MNFNVHSAVTRGHAWLQAGGVGQGRRAGAGLLNMLNSTLFSSSRLPRRRKSQQMLEISGTTKTGV